jgi:hypothetical protein
VVDKLERINQAAIESEAALFVAVERHKHVLMDHSAILHEALKEFSLQTGLTLKLVEDAYRNRPDPHYEVGPPNHSHRYAVTKETTREKEIAGITVVKSALLSSNRFMFHGYSDRDSEEARLGYPEIPWDDDVRVLTYVALKLNSPDNMKSRSYVLVEPFDIMQVELDELFEIVAGAIEISKTFCQSHNERLDKLWAIHPEGKKFSENMINSFHYGIFEAQKVLRKLLDQPFSSVLTHDLVEEETLIAV